MGRRLGEPLKLSERARAQRQKWKDKNRARVKAAAAEYRKRHPNAARDYYAAHGERLREHQRNRPPLYSMLVNAKTRAKAKGIEFDISAEDVVFPERCPYFGLELRRNRNGRILDNSPTLDRIDVRKGYVKGNVEVISNRANRIKNDGTAEEHRQIAERMTRLANPS